jgi:LL-diaminopimelate aminotransferase
MLDRNPCIAALKAGYLFPEIARRRREFAASHPDAKIISLGVGNTTEPILPCIAQGLVDGAKRLMDSKTYSGYMDEGLVELRQNINSVFYNNKFSADEIFISDGSKCDIGRLQLLFGRNVNVAVQDPSYPVYVDGSVIIGAATNNNGGGYAGITYLPCNQENNYFPDLSIIKKNSLIYFCSPNNPTGAVATKAQLKALVDAALNSGSIIIFDAAYSEYIRDASLPKSIFEIENADSCAIEVNSFSKSAGFTGVRLGWTLVPKKLKFADGKSINEDWARIVATIFNGASNIAQYGALAALTPDGQKELCSLTDYYLKNAQCIKNALQKLNINCVGGDNSPYIWAHFPGEDSWDVFERILKKCNVVTTPGSGFGPAGESFVRFSAFGHYADVEEACKRLQTGFM